MSLSVSKSLTSRSSARIQMQSLDGSWTPSPGQVVDIQLDGSRKFVGRIDSVEPEWDSQSSALRFDVLCASYDSIAGKRVAENDFSFEAGTAGSVISAYATQFLGGENLSLDVAAGNTIGPGTIRAGQLVEEGLDELAKLGGLYWDIVGAPGLPELRAFARGGLTAPVSITASDTAAHARVKVRRGVQDYANRIYARIASGSGAETAHDQYGDGSTRSFEVPAPISQIVSVSVGGATKTVAVQGSGTTAQFYWQSGSSAVTQDDGETILTGSNLLSVAYRPVADLVVLAAQNATEVSARQAVEGGSGKYEMVIDASGTLVADAEAQAAAVLAARQTMPQTVTITVDAIGDYRGLDIGQLLTITLPGLSLSGQWLIESIEMATDGLVAGSPHHMVYSLVASKGVAATSDWARALATAWGRPANLVGGIQTDGTPSSTPDPGTLTFTPALHEYGSISLEELAITGGTPNTLDSVTVFPVFVDELTSDVWAEISSDPGTSDPANITVSYNPNRTTPAGPADFGVGDFVVFNEAGKYEVAQITALSGTSWTLQRHWPGDSAGNAIFGSLRQGHASGTRIYRLATREFTFAASRGSYDEETGITSVPDRLDIALPNACVVALVASPIHGGAYGPWTYYNLSLPTLPGFRTCVGARYTFEIGGSLAADQVPPVPVRVGYSSSYRVAYAEVGTAPVGASLLLKLRVSLDSGSTWSDVETLTIAAGAKRSFDASTQPPEPRRSPYSGSWPFQRLFQEYLLNIQVTQVGSTTPGSDLMVTVDV